MLIYRITNNLMLIMKPILITVRELIELIKERI